MRLRVNEGLKDRDAVEPVNVSLEWRVGRGG